MALLPNRVDLVGVKSLLHVGTRTRTVLPGLPSGSYNRNLSIMAYEVENQIGPIVYRNTPLYHDTPTHQISTENHGVVAQSWTPEWDVWVQISAKSQSRSP
jgi:hypothetical protein